MTPLQKYLNKELKKYPEVKTDLDKFGEAINTFLTENDIQILINISKGTQKPEIWDNVGLGTVVAFYVILKTIVPIARKMFESLDKKGLGISDKEGLADALCGLVKEEIMEA